MEIGLEMAMKNEMITMNNNNNIDKKNILQKNNKTLIRRIIQ